MRTFSGREDFPLRELAVWLAERTVTPVLASEVGGATLSDFSNKRRKRRGVKEQLSRVNQL